MFNREKIMENKMKSASSLMILPLILAGFLLGVTAAQADPLSITLLTPIQTGLPGDILSFTATVTNDSAEMVYLNGDFALVDSPLKVDDSPYFSGYPLTLGAGDSYTGVLFNVDIPSGAPVALYGGSFEIIGGVVGTGDTDVVGTANFNVQVAPEPSSLLLLASGLAALAGIIRRRMIR